MVTTYLAILLLFVAGAVRTDEPPIVDVIREMIYETNQELAKNHRDHLKLPNIGVFSWDPIKMRNGTLGVFSTMELIGETKVQQVDKPDGTMELNLDLQVGLGNISIQYDFHINVLGLYVKNGVAVLRTSNDSAHCNVTVAVSQEGKCSAKLNFVEVKEMDDFKIEVQPDTIPFMTETEESLLDFLTPKTLPLVNLVIKEAAKTDYVQKMFSKKLCEKLPL